MRGPPRVADARRALEARREVRGEVGHPAKLEALHDAAGKAEPDDRLPVLQQIIASLAPLALAGAFAATPAFAEMVTAWTSAESVVKW